MCPCMVEFVVVCVRRVFVFVFVVNGEVVRIVSLSVLKGGPWLFVYVVHAMMKYMLWCIRAVRPTANNNKT